MNDDDKKNCEPSIQSLFIFFMYPLYRRLVYYVGLIRFYTTANLTIFNCVGYLLPRMFTYYATLSFTLNNICLLYVCCTVKDDEYLRALSLTVAAITVVFKLWTRISIMLMMMIHLIMIMLALILVFMFILVLVFMLILVLLFMLKLILKQ